MWRAAFVVVGLASAFEEGCAGSGCPMQGNTLLQQTQQVSPLNAAGNHMDAPQEHLAMKSGGEKEMVDLSSGAVDNVISEDYHRLLGCYEDKKTRQFKNGSTRVPGANTVRACFKLCHNFKFMAVQDGNECFCGNTYESSYKQLADSNCSSKCLVTNGCGGSWKNSVYMLEAYSIMAASDGKGGTNVSGGQYLKMCNDDDKVAKADKSASCEQFWIKSTEDGFYSIMAAERRLHKRGGFLCKKGTEVVTETSILDCAKFSIKSTNDGFYSIMANDGLYLSMCKGVRFVTTAENVDVCEKFVLTMPKANPIMAASDGKGGTNVTGGQYLKMCKDDGKVLKAVNVTPCEKFDIQSTEDGFYSIMTDRFYLKLCSGETEVVRAGKVDVCEKFHIKSTNDGFYSIKANDGRYLSMCKGAQFVTTAQHVDVCEKFVLTMPTANPIMAKSRGRFVKMCKNDKKVATADKVDVCEKFYIKSTDDGFYSIMSAESRQYIKKCGHVEDVAISDKVGNCEKFQINSTNDGFYSIREHKAGGRYLRMCENDQEVTAVKAEDFDDCAKFFLTMPE